MFEWTFFQDCLRGFCDNYEVNKVGIEIRRKSIIFSICFSILSALVLILVTYISTKYRIKVDLVYVRENVNIMPSYDDYL